MVCEACADTKQRFLYRRTGMTMPNLMPHAPPSDFFTTFRSLFIRP